MSAPTAELRTQRCDPPPPRRIARADAFDPASPVEAYAVHGLQALFGGFALYENDDHVVISGEWSTRPIDIIATGHDDTSVTVTVRGSRYGNFVQRLDWWLHSYRGGGMGINQDKPWKPFAGRIRVEQGLPDLINSVGSWGLTWGDCLAVGGINFYDFSGLTPQRQWTALDAGSSLDRIGAKVVGFPLLTILACVGLQFAPVRRSHRGAGLYGRIRYGLFDIGTQHTRFYESRLVYRGEYFYGAGYAHEMPQEQVAELHPI
jgi:hypothetical protein